MVSKILDSMPEGRERSSISQQDWRWLSWAECIMGQVLEETLLAQQVLQFLEHPLILSKLRQSGEGSKNQTREQIIGHYASSAAVCKAHYDYCN
jgi:hypothetical protein